MQDIKVKGHSDNKRMENRYEAMTNETSGAYNSYVDHTAPDPNETIDEELKEETDTIASENQERKKSPLRDGKQAVKKRDFIEECREIYNKNPTPLKLGNFYCLWYNQVGQPRIVLGPDYIFSLVELVALNGIGAYVLHEIGWSHSLVQLSGLIILLFQNICFLSTVLFNPGLAPRDPRIH